ncbi:MAG: hypothetical protein LBS09_03660 [Bacteroidales bacterium]|jgi:hypothetical protein|nr:hypothetical protein [Bacteroidales bacterium]
MAWYEIVLVASSAVFLLMLVVSLFFGDMDLDVHADGFLMGDIVSFKGLIHFCVGLSLTLTLMREFTVVSAALGTAAGIVKVTVSNAELEVIKAQSQGLALSAGERAKAEIEKNKELARKEAEEARAKRTEAALKAEQVKAIEHIRLGNVNVMDTAQGNTLTNLLTGLVASIAPVTDIMKTIPGIPNALKGKTAEKPAKQPSEPKSPEQA